MRLLAIAAAAATLSLAIGIGVRAQTTGPYVFATVDAVSSQNSQLKVTGILQGQAAATEVTANFSYGTDYAAANVAAQTCERKALLAMAKPGQYLFGISYSYGTWICKLTRVNP